MARTGAYRRVHPGTSMTFYEIVSYDIVITTEGGNKIELTARLIRQDGDVLGFEFVIMK